MKRSGWMLVAGLVLGVVAGGAAVALVLTRGAEPLRTGAALQLSTVPAATAPVGTERALRDDEPALWSVVVRYWNRTWIPLIEDLVAAAEPENESELRVTCEVVKSGPAEMIEEASEWRGSELRDLSIAMFEEMERALLACSTGEWEDFNDSRDLLAVYIEKINVCRDKGIRC